MGGHRRLTLGRGRGDHLIIGGVAGPELHVTPDPVTRGRGQTWPGVRVVSLGQGVRGAGQGHGRVLPVVRVVSRVMGGLGLGLRHTQQLGIAHPL